MGPYIFQRTALYDHCEFDKHFSEMGRNQALFTNHQIITKHGTSAFNEFTLHHTCTFSNRKTLYYILLYYVLIKTSINTFEVVTGWSSMFYDALMVINYCLASAHFRKVFVKFNLVPNSPQLWREYFQILPTRGSK